MLLCELMSCLLNRVRLGEHQRASGLGLMAFSWHHFYFIRSFLLTASRAARGRIAVVPDVCRHGLDGVGKVR